MYQVTIKNGSESTVINAVSTHIDAPRLLDGNIKQGINVINNFTFTILPNNKGYEKIHPFSTLVEVLNTKTNKIEFEGRVLNCKSSMNNNGLFSKTVVCEDEFALLMDSVQKYGEYHNISVKNFLQTIINNHNSQVAKDKRFVLGEVTVTDPNDSLYRYLGYTKTFETINDKLIDRLGGELQIRKVNGIRYLDYLVKVGNKKTTEIKISKNLKELTEEKDASNIITRLIPIGATIEKELSSEEDEKTQEESEKLTIASVNNNIIYIDDLDAQAKYGIIVDTIEFSDVTKASNLLRKGQEFLKQNNKINKKYSLDALDLSVIGLEVDSFEVGNEYRVINPIMEIDEYLRVIDKSIDINNPQNSKLTVGQKFEDIKKNQINTNKKIISLNNINNINKSNLKTHKKAIVKAEKNITNVANNLDSFINDVSSSYFIDEGVIYPQIGKRFHIEYDDSKYTIKVKYDLTSRPYILSKSSGRILNGDELKNDKQFVYQSTDTKINSVHNLYINLDTKEFMIKHYSEALTYEECTTHIYICTFSKIFFSGCNGAKETFTINGESII